jgi:hypothetical protein
MLPAKIKRDREYQRTEPSIDRVGDQRLVRPDVVGDQPDDEPDEGHGATVTGAANPWLVRIEGEADCGCRYGRGTLIVEM